MADLENTRLRRRLEDFSELCSFMVVVFGLITLSGWAFHIQTLKSFVPGQVAVKANTAACFLLIGIALWLVRRRETSASFHRKLAAQILALIVSAVGLLSFLEGWNGWDLGIDQLLFYAGAEDIPGSIRPGLMSPITGMGFCLLGTALMLLDSRRRRVQIFLQNLCCIVALVSIFGLLDFIFDPGKNHTYISPVTAVALVLLSFGIVSSRSDYYLGALFASSALGGEVARRLLPAAIVVPIVIGWLRWKGEYTGIYSEWSGVAIMTVACVTLLAIATIWTAFLIDRTDSEGKKAAESVRRLAAVVTSSNHAIISKTLEGIVTNWNAGAEAIYGYSAAEMMGQPATIVVPPDRVNEFRAIMQRVARGEMVDQYETVRVRNDGRSIDVSISVSPLRDESGNVVGASTIAHDISDRKRAEEALQRERQRFRDVLDKLPVYVILLTPDYHVALDNTLFRERFGESHGKHCYEFLFGRNKPCDICETYNVLKTGKPHQWKWTGPDGRHYDIFDFPFTDGDGSPLILEMGMDVTEREKAEKALHLSEKRHRSLVTATAQIVWTTDAAGEVSEDMPMWREFTGMNLEQIKGSGWINSLHPEDRRRTAAVWAKAVKERGLYDIEYRLRRHDGEYRDMSVRGVPVLESDGNIREWIGTCTDITERKRAEAEIRALNRNLEKRVEERTSELRESESRIRRKLDSILSPEGDLADLELADILDIPAIQALAEDFYKVTNIPLFMLDLKGKCLVGAGWQEICTRFHRVHPESCKNCLESDLFLTHGVSAGELKLYKCKNNMWDAVTPMMLGDKHLGNVYTGQFFFVDEPIDYELFRSQAHKYGFDEQDYMAALDRVPRLSRDQVETSRAFFTKFAQVLSQLSYSAIKLARSIEETRNANTQLLASNKELEAFSYSVSHDLRAPLRHISAFSKILMEEFAPQLPPEAQHHLQRVEEGTRRMGMLVDDLLGLARVGRCDLVLQVAGLKSVVDEVITNLMQDADDRQVEWRIGDLPYMECDPALVKQVFQNLLANALKFTRPRSKAVIEVGQIQQDGASIIYVRDNGVGFSMKYADKLFGVFQRLHRTEDFEGTGVGLATVQRIVQKHGGRIWAEAELEKGATFYFTLSKADTVQQKANAAFSGATT